MGQLPPEGILPTLADAITVCRALDIRYLWVDALCILQDSVQDWEEQSLVMGEIFSGSLVTICAVSSTSCRSGFLQRSRLPLVGEIPVIDQDAGIVLGHLAMRDPGPDTSPQSLASCLLWDLDHSRWNRRGWVFQEKTLAPNKFLFGRTQCHFQEGGMVTSENGVLQYFDRLTHHNHPGVVSSTMWEDLGQHAHDSWYVIAYRARPLLWTVAEDLLPGLSSLAAMFHRVTNDTYLAGLWKNDLHCGLLWQGPKRPAGIKDPPVSLTNLLEYLQTMRAPCDPSWSWLSGPFFKAGGGFMIGRGSLHTCRTRTHLRPEFDVAEASVVVRGKNPFGSIKDSTLRLSARTVPVPKSFAPAHARTFEDSFRMPAGHAGWAQKDFQGVTGQDKQEETLAEFHERRLRFLLISSCCSDCPGAKRTHAAAAAEPHASSGSRLFEHQRAINANQRLAYPRDNQAQDVAMARCIFCSDRIRKRDIWGLLVYETDTPGKFYRVGTFLSRAEQGGLDMFEGVEKQLIELL